MHHGLSHGVYVQAMMPMRDIRRACKHHFWELEDVLNKGDSVQVEVVVITRAQPAGRRQLGHTRRHVVTVKPAVQLTAPRDEVADAETAGAGAGAGTGAGAGAGAGVNPADAVAGSAIFHRGGRQLPTSLVASILTFLNGGDLEAAAHTSMLVRAAAVAARTHAIVKRELACFHTKVREVSRCWVDRRSSPWHRSVSARIPGQRPRSWCQPGVLPRW